MCRIWSVFEKWRRDVEISVQVTESGFYQKLAKLAKGTYTKIKAKVDGDAKYCYKGMIFNDYEWNDIDCCWELQCDEDTAAADEAFFDLSCPPHNEE